MNIEELREYCLSMKGAEECMPFDQDTMVYKVMGKMFAFFGLTPHGDEHWLVLKCNPERSAELRERYRGIFKGYYAGNNLQWNTVSIESDVPDNLICKLISHSVDEVVKKLPKYKQAEYKEM